MLYRVYFKQIVAVILWGEMDFYVVGDDGLVYTGHEHSDDLILSLYHFVDKNGFYITPDGDEQIFWCE